MSLPWKPLRTVPGSFPPNKSGQKDGMGANSFLYAVPLFPTPARPRSRVVGWTVFEAVTCLEERQRKSENRAGSVLSQRPSLTPLLFLLLIPGVPPHHPAPHLWPCDGPHGMGNPSSLQISHLLESYLPLSPSHQGLRVHHGGAVPPLGPKP